MSTFGNLSNATLLDPLCQSAAKILQTPGLGVLLGLDFLVGISAIFLNVLLFIAVWHVSLFHLNLRLVIGHLALGAIIFCTAIVAKASILVQHMVWNTPCRLVTDAYICKIREIPTSWMSQIQLYGCASITLERLYCTVRYKKPYQGFPWLGILLVLCCYIAPVQNFVRIISTNNGNVAVCEFLLSTSAESARINLSINSTCALVSISLVCILHYYNRYQLRRMLINRAITHTLSARFQLEQNIQLTQIISPSAVLEVFTFLPNQIFLFCFIVGMNLSYETKTILIQCHYFWKMCFSFAYPVLAFAKNVHLRRGLIKAMPRVIQKYLALDGDGTASQSRVVKITPKGLQTKSQVKTHFEILNEMWTTRYNSERPM